ncbi:MAG: alpha-amylase family glycosyl hydrolase [Vicinamibacterales bacterium]
MIPDLLIRRRTAFVLWRPQLAAVPPALVLGTFQPGNPPTLADRREIALTLVPGTTDLWAVSAAACGLIDGTVYHYWFEVTDSSPFRDGRRILCADPLAHTVDWRLTSTRLPDPYSVDDQAPASVVTFAGGALVPCDPGGERLVAAAPIAATDAAANNRIVIYELPTSWTRINVEGAPQVGVGSFRDVLALVDRAAEGANFTGCSALDAGRSYLRELGINALELLPPADSFVDREWGYATSNYCAPDHDLGFPEGDSSPTPNTDLVALIDACHACGIRFFIDVVMAFGTHDPLEHLNFEDFHIAPELSPGDPDDQQSGGQGTRDGFGGRLWRYARSVTGYDPLSGATNATLVPARAYLQTYLLRWMADFAVDGIRMDSINNIANWDFVQEFKDRARAAWQARGGSDETFLVVGEELSVPLALVQQRRLDGLWNEQFKRLVRNAVLGRRDDKAPDFETTVRRMIDCRLLGFTDGAQAVNYLGSHDVEGYRNERLFNFLQNNGVWQTEERIKLAFACLLTAVGIPQILAGDEFADQHDLSVGNPAKQQDAVNYDRVDEPFRRRVFDYVSRLVKLRTSEPALSVNETEFLHTDFDGKRVMVWRRGVAGSDSQVVVVANFSDFGTDTGVPGAEYRVPTWPATPDGLRWREVTQDRDVPDEWVGREPIFAWEAKVYVLRPS